METIYHLEDLKTLKGPIALTIGMFDGLHLGHQSILKELNRLSKDKGGSSVVITFTSHPLETLKPGVKVPKIMAIQEKLQLLKEYGVDVTVLLTFDQELRLLSYEAFMDKILSRLPLDHLVLGEGAAFGQGQKGDEKALRTLGSAKGFSCTYLQKFETLDHVVSSKLIRDVLRKGDLETAHKLLGRPYSIYAPLHVSSLQETGAHLLKITFNFDNHCHLPSGSYLVRLHTALAERQALAYLTTIGGEQESKVFNLEIYVKGSVSDFMSDQVKVELLRLIPSPQITQMRAPLKDNIFFFDQLIPPPKQEE